MGLVAIGGQRCLVCMQKVLTKSQVYFSFACKRLHAIGLHAKGLDQISGVLFVI